jgi:hypothetical protein
MHRAAIFAIFEVASNSSLGFYTDVNSTRFASFSLPDEDIPTRLIDIIQVYGEELTSPSSGIQQAKENHSISVSSKCPPFTNLNHLGNYIYGNGVNWLRWYFGWFDFSDGILPSFGFDFILVPVQEGTQSTIGSVPDSRIETSLF